MPEKVLVTNQKYIRPLYSIGAHTYKTLYRIMLGVFGQKKLIVRIVCVHLVLSLTNVLAVHTSQI